MFEIPENLTSLSNEELAALVTGARAEFATFTAIESPTPAQAADAEALAAGFARVQTEIADRAAAADRIAALSATFSEPEPEVEEEPVEESDDEAPVEEQPAEEAPAEAPAEAPSSQAAVEAPVLNTAALEGQRPPARQVTSAPRIFAAADVPGVAAGAELTLAQMVEAALERTSRFPVPQGTSETFGSDPAQLHQFGLASVRKPISDDLRITDNMSGEEIMAVFERASDEKRLPGGSLTAAGGWCSPSPVSYDLTAGETEEGMLQAPETTWGRGGIKRTLGPDWSDIFSATSRFTMTEAQAIAGSFTKPCMTIACPTWQDLRLDAVGLCIQIPFLTESAFPELVKRWISGAMTAYAHKANADKIARLVAAIGAAEVALDTTSTAGSLFGAIRFFIDRERAKRRWSMNQAMEVVLPYWVKGAIKLDIAQRTGQPFQIITDQQIAALFRDANANPQYVYDWQDLTDTQTGYYGTFDMLIYKAGTFVFGTTDVVNLSNVYDAASLKDNIYTGLFMEEGLQLARMGYGGIRVTVAVNSSGHTGSANIAVPYVDATP